MPAYNLQNQMGRLPSRGPFGDNIDRNPTNVVMQQMGAGRSLIGAQAQNTRDEIAAYKEYFGQPRYNPEVAKDLSLPRTHYDLPDAWTGSNQFLAQVMIRQISSQHLYPVTDLAPMVLYEQGIDLSWSIWKFADGQLDNVPEEAIGRLMTATKDEKSATMRRYGKALMIERTFYKTAKGRMSWAFQLKQIANATLETLCSSVMFEFYNDDMPRFSDHDRVNAFSDERQLMDTLATFKYYFGILNKQANGLAEVMAHMDKQLLQHPEGLTPNVFVFPNGTFELCARRPENNLFAWETGKISAMSKFQGDERRMKSLFTKKRVYLSLPFLTGDGVRKADRAKQVRSVGGFDRMWYREVELGDDSDFRTKMRDIFVFDGDADNFVRKSYRDTLLDRSGLFFKNPQTGDYDLTDHLGRAFFENCHYIGDMLESEGVLDRVARSILKLPDDDLLEFYARFVRGTDLDRELSNALQTTGRNAEMNGILGGQGSAFLDDAEWKAFINALQANAPQPQQQPINQQPINQQPNNNPPQSTFATDIEAFLQKTTLGRDYKSYLSWLISTSLGILGKQVVADTRKANLIGQAAQAVGIQGSPPTVFNVFKSLTQGGDQELFMHTKDMIDDLHTNNRVAMKIELFQLALHANSALGYSAIVPDFQPKAKRLGGLFGHFPSIEPYKFVVLYLAAMHSTTASSVLPANALANRPIASLPLFKCEAGEILDCAREIEPVWGANTNAWQAKVRRQLSYVLTAALFTTSFFASVPFETKQGTKVDAVKGLLQEFAANFKGANAARGNPQDIKTHLIDGATTVWDLAPWFQFARPVVLSVLHLIHTYATAPQTVQDTDITQLASLGAPSGKSESECWDHFCAQVRLANYPVPAGAVRNRHANAVDWADADEKARPKLLTDYDIFADGGPAPNDLKSGQVAGADQWQGHFRGAEKARKESLVKNARQLGGGRVSGSLSLTQFDRPDQILTRRAAQKLLLDCPLLIKNFPTAVHSIYLKYVYTPEFASDLMTTGDLKDDLANRLSSNEFRRLMQLLDMLLEKQLNEAADPKATPDANQRALKRQEAYDKVDMFLTTIYFGGAILNTKDKLTAVFPVLWDKILSKESATREDIRSITGFAPLLRSLAATADLLLYLRKAFDNQHFAVVADLNAGAFEGFVDNFYAKGGRKNAKQGSRSRFSEQKSALEDAVRGQPRVNSLLYPQDEIDKGLQKIRAKFPSANHWKDVLAQLPTTCAGFFQFALDHNFLIPIDFTGFRCHRTYLMGSAIGLRGDGEAANTFFGHRDFQIGHDATRKVFQGNWTLYAKPVVHSPHFVANCQDVMFSGVMGGVGSKDWDPNNSTDVLNMHQGEVFQKDYIWVPHLFSDHFVSNVVDFTGFWDGRLLAPGSDTKPFLSFMPTVAAYWGIKHDARGSPLHRNFDTSETRFHPIYNTVCSANAYRVYTQTGRGEGGWTKEQRNYGPEGFMYPGCAAIWNGNNEPLQAEGATRIAYAT